MTRDDVQVLNTYQYKGHKYIMAGFTIKFFPRIFLRKSLTDELLIMTWEKFLKNFELVSVHLKHDLNSDDAIDLHKKWLERPVDQYTKKGVFVKSFVSIEEASKAFNRHPVNIYNCARGDTRTSAKFIWRFSK